MDLRVRRREESLHQNGDITPPAPSSEAEDGYDTSTAMDGSKVWRTATVVAPFTEREKQGF